MSEPHPLMAMMLSHNSFVGGAEEVEADIMPLDDQLKFTVGDAALMASANTPLEDTTCVLRMVNAEEHAETWPDWVEREFNSFVLCEAFSREDREITLGWFSRLKLLPIPKYRYKETRRWIKAGFPDDLPEWVMVRYRKYTDQLSERAPSTVPHSVRCPHCKSQDIQLVVKRRLTYTARVGVIVVEGHEYYVPTEQPNESSTHGAQLHCTSCDSTADLDDEDWNLPGISN